MSHRLLLLLPLRQWGRVHVARLRSGVPLSTGFYWRVLRTFDLRFVRGEYSPVLRRQHLHLQRCGNDVRMSLPYLQRREILQRKYASDALIYYFYDNFFAFRSFICLSSVLWKQLHWIRRSFPVCVPNCAQQI